MKKQLSIITSALVLSSVALSANSIDEAFKNGKVSGDIVAHYHTSEEGSTDEGFSAASIGLNYETTEVNGISATVGFRANTKLSEEENGDYSAEMTDNASLTQAFVKYENDSLAISAGRQEIDLEWLGDFNDSVVAVLKTIPDTTVTAGWTTRQAAIGADEHGEFERVNKGNGGAYVLDAKYEGIENVELNPYFYSAKEVADFYGLKADYNTDSFGATVHYAASSEKAAGAEDGSILHVEARAAVSGAKLALGYIKPDSDAGVASMESFGENIDPTEELGVYDADTNTIYATVGYEVSGVALSALYGVKDLANSEKDKELTLGAEYSFTDSLTGDIMYTDLSKGTAGEDDFSKFTANLTYEF